MKDPRLLPSRRALLQAAVGLTAFAAGCDRLPEALVLSGLTDPPAPPPPRGSEIWTLLGGPADGEHVIISGMVAQEINRTGRFGPRVGVRASMGSAYNMRGVSSGLALLGMAQSQILLGSADEPTLAISSLRGRLRVIGQLNYVASTLLVLPDRGIDQLTDLAGRTLAVLQPGQTPIGTLKLLGAAAGLPVEDAATASPGAIGVVALTLPEVEAALNSGAIDGFFCSASHPSSLVYRLLGRTPARLCPIVISPERLAATSSAYTSTTISASLYPATEGHVDVSTVSSRNVLFTLDSTPAPLVRSLAEALWAAVERLAAFPLLSGMNWAGLAYGVDPATFHPGALAWYQEQGLAEREVVATAFSHAPVGLIAADMNDPIAIRAASAVGSAVSVSSASLSELVIGVSSGRFDKAVLSADGLDRLRALSPAALEPLTARNVLLADRLLGAPLQLIGRAPPPSKGRRAPPPAPRRLVDLAGKPVGVTDSVGARALARLGALLTAAKLAPPQAVELLPEGLSEALRLGKIEGFLVVEPPPSAVVAAALDKRVGGVLIPLDDAEIAALAVGGWEADELPAASYAGLPAVKTVGAPAFVLVADTLTTPSATARPLWTALGATRPGAAPPLCVGGGLADAPSFRVAVAIARSYAVAFGDGPSPVGEAGAPSEVVAMPTGPADDTVVALRSGHVGLAVVSASAVVAASAGSSFSPASAAPAPEVELRGVCALYTRALTALVTSPAYLSRVNSFIPSGNAALRVRATDSAPEILDLSGLGGHRVSIRQDLKPTPRTNALSIFSLPRFVNEQWVTAVQSPEPLPEVAIDLFVRGKIDALFWMTEHPSMEVDMLIHACDGAHILPITGIDDAPERVPSAQLTLIDVAPYQNLSAPSLLPTVGIPVVLVGTEGSPDLAVSAMLRAIESGIELLRRDVPVLYRLNRDTLEPGPGVELHPAAERFFSLRKRASD